MEKVRKLIEVEEKLKKRIVEEVESGYLSQSEAAKTYGLSRTAIQKWLKQYGKLRLRTQIVKVVMQEESKKIKELQEALGEAHLKLKYYDKLFEIGKSDYGIDLKKTVGTEQLKSSKEQE